MATRKPRRQKKAKEAVQKRRVREIEMELEATPLTPPVEVDGTASSVVDDPEPRTQIILTVLEHGLSTAEPPLYERLGALVDTRLSGDICN